MRKLILLAIFVAASAPFTYAQTEYNKVEGAVLFSHNRVDTGIGDDDPQLDDFIDEREGFNGFNASITGNLSRYVGLKADYAFHRRSFSDSLAGVSVDADLDIHNFVGGVQFKDNSKETKVKPFAHLMAGLAHSRFDATVTGIPGFTGDNDSETGFAGVFGGGIDIRVSDRVDFRVVQFDYNPMRNDGQTAHNFRVGIGLVFH